MYTETQAKILLLDIETSPAKVYSWGIYEQDIPINHIIDYPHLLCWSAKWLGEDKILSDAQINYPTAFKKNPKDDSKVARSIHALLDECDIAVAHNGDQFDFKKLNTFFLKNGMAAPSPYRTIDTKKVSKGNFGFISNKLDSLCRELEIGAKLQHSGMSLWTGCMAGDRAAWATMIRYNKQDVKLLEELYLELLPYMKTHPGIHFADSLSCPNCTSKDTQKRGWIINRGGKYQRHQCRQCGAWFKGEKIRSKLQKLPERNV